MTTSIEIMRHRVNAFDLAKAKAQQGEVEFAGGTISNGGSGSTTAGPRNITAQSGATAGASSLWRTSGSVGLSRGQSRMVVNFSKRQVWKITIAHLAGTTNGRARVTIGKNDTDAQGALARKGLGIEVQNAALKGLAHNGVSLTTVDLATTLAADTVYEVRIEADGAGRVEWSVNGVSKGSTAAGGPTGNSDNNAVIQVEAMNGGDAANQAIQVAQIAYAIEQ